MNNQQHSAHLSISSSTEIEQTAHQLRATREKFLATGMLAEQSPRPMILESWKRCHYMQVSPLLCHAPLAINHEVQLRHLLEINEVLLRAANPVMSHLSDFLTGYVIVLSDARGCLLKIIGNARMRRRLARIDFVPGGDWSEGAAGTNAPGTSIANGHVVQLLGAEHFCEGWQDLTCTAAPIRHPVTGEIVGTLDVTGNYRLIRPFLSGFIGAAALQIQQELHAQITSNKESAAFQYPRSSQRTCPPLSNDEPRHLVNATATPVTKTARSAHSTGLSYRIQEQRVHNAECMTIAVSAISASLDIDVTLDTIARQTAHLLKLDSAAVCLFDEDKEIASLHIWTKQYARHMRFRRDLEELLQCCEETALIQERGEPVIIDDASVMMPTGSAQGIHSLLLLPLIAARGVIGLIAASRETHYHWTVDDVLPGLTLATHAASAIENARHFTILQQHTRRIEALNTLTQLLGALSDPGQHLEVILQRIVEIMGLNTGMTLLWDQHTECLTLATHYGLSETVSPDLCTYSLRPLYEVAYLVVTTGKSLLACGLEKDRHGINKTLDTIGFCDMMVVPLASGSTIFGVLLVGSHAHHKLTQEDLALFTAIGQQLGLALTNVRLQHTANETEAIHEAEQLKNRFVTAVSHDLQSPLTAIQASVESLLDQREAHTLQTQKHLLQNIAAQAGRLDQLVDQLLDLSRIEAGLLSLDRDWIDLPVLLADTLAKFAALHDECRVEQDLTANMPLLYIDADRIAQVVWNLLENARKYAPSGALIEMEARWTGSEAMIGIADRGPGIPAGDREKIFQHFYRLKRDQRKLVRGSGLGLAICQGIVQAHGGRIWVEERAGSGSIFRFTLPEPATALFDPELL